MNYGEFGGQYVPQELKEKLNEIEKEFLKVKDDERKNLITYTKSDIKTLNKHDKGTKYSVLYH